MAKETVKVTFTEVAAWQKKNCLYCENEAKLQANAGEKNKTASLRCCENEDCKKRAEVEAQNSILAMRAA